jgi:5-methylcytosine-specific restriction endonuclease McrA
MKAKQSVRLNFRQDVFKRDKYCCQVCGVDGKDRQGGDEHLKFHKASNPVDLDAHHIVSRDKAKDGGYSPETESHFVTNVM